MLTISLLLASVVILFVAFGVYGYLLALRQERVAAAVFFSITVLLLGMIVFPDKWVPASLVVWG